MMQKDEILFKSSSNETIVMDLNKMSSDTNQRYNSVRERLDKRNFHHFLHPDSVALVDKLLNEYMSVCRNHESLKKTLSQGGSQASSNTSYASRNE